MSMAFRTCPECRWNKVGYYCGKQFTLNGFECINFDKKEKKAIKKDPHKDNIRWLTEEEVFEGLEDIINSKVDLNKMQDELIGKIITISYFEISTNKQGEYGFRFPTWKGKEYIRADKEGIDDTNVE